QQVQTEAARRQAERNLDLALRALEEIFLRWDEEGRVRAPRPDGVDELFLGRALQLFEELDRENGENLNVRRGLALAWDQQGNLRELLGQHQAAAEAYQRSLELSERLRAAKPNDYLPRCMLADSHQGLGRLLSGPGDARAAGAHRRISLELWSRL